MTRGSLAAVAGIVLVSWTSTHGQHISHSPASGTGSPLGALGAVGDGQSGSVAISSPFFGGAAAVSGGYGDPFGWGSWGGYGGYAGPYGNPYPAWGMPGPGLMFPGVFNGGMPVNGVPGNGMNFGNGNGPLIPAAANMPPNRPGDKPAAKTPRSRRAKAKRAGPGR